MIKCVKPGNMERVRFMDKQFKAKKFIGNLPIILIVLPSRFLSLTQKESNLPKMYFSEKLNSLSSLPTFRFLTFW